VRDSSEKPEVCEISSKVSAGKRAVTFEDLRVDGLAASRSLGKPDPMK
jgi:hypothetical protein